MLVHTNTGWESLIIWGQNKMWYQVDIANTCCWLSWLLIFSTLYIFFVSSIWLMLAKLCFFRILSCLGSDNTAVCFLDVDLWMIFHTVALVCIYLYSSIFLMLVSLSWHRFLTIDSIDILSLNSNNHFVLTFNFR